MIGDFSPRASAAALTVLAAGLRLWNLDAAQYRADDFTVSTAALAIARTGALPTGIISSIGIDNGPAGPLLLLPAALVSSDPQVLAVWVALLNTAMAPLAYAVGRALFGAQAGLLAAALVAVNPWLVGYGRRLWLNAFIAPMALLFLWAVLAACRSESRPRWALAGAVLAISAQVHLSSLPNLVAFASLLAFVPRIALGSIAVGAVAAGVLLAPWATLSFVPQALAFNLGGAVGSGGVSGNSLERATIVVTGVAYQSLTGQGARILDATAPPFSWLDVGARALAVAGWAFLVGQAWRERERRPPVAAVSLVMALMVAVPTLALLRPLQTGQLPYVYPFYFLNLVPPLVLGMTGLVSVAPAALRGAGAGLLGLIAAAHLTLAFPFFATQEEFWPLGDYGVPWKYTHAFVESVRAAAEPQRSPVFVGGHEDDNEQSIVIARLLQRDYGPVRLHDSRDGLVYRVGEGPVVLVTTNDEHVMTRFLLTYFADRQVVEQVLPGAGWTRRAFRLQPDEIERWAAARLPAAPPAASEGLVSYERVGLSNHLLGERTAALLWRLNSDAPEPFFTDLVFSQEGTELLRDRHVAYPASWWQPGDWLATRMLNLFRVSAEEDFSPQTALALEHRGVVSGRALAPRVELGPGWLVDQD